MNMVDKKDNFHISLPFERRSYSLYTVRVFLLPIIVVTQLITLTSCETENKWEYKNTAIQTVVVDAMLIDSNIRQTICLTRPITQLNEKAKAASGAQVQVSNAEKVYNFTENPSGTGIYISDSAFACSTQFEYSLLTTIDEKAYTAKAIMKPVVEFEKARYNFLPGKHLYRINWIANPYDELNPAMYELVFDWSKAQGYESAPYEETHATIRYYSLPTLDVSEMLAPTIQTLLFPSGTNIIEKRYSLSDEHAAFLRGMLLETNWQGGLFNTSAAQVPTNISNGGLGFFGACSVIGKNWEVK